jgi:predicted DNA-binding transcriptional regulator YafY
MPKNKLASFRYRIINNCLRNTGRQWKMQDLIDEISKKLDEDFGMDKGISKRTFHYDIELMRSLPPRGFDAPIKSKDGYYFYEDPCFSIENTPLNETDIETINNAITLLSQFSKLPIHEELAVVKEKLYGEALQNPKHDKVIDFEQRQVKGSEHLAPLFKAINEKQPLIIDYKPFKSDSHILDVIHPYLLKQYNHRWYLVGLNHNYGRIGVYSLDRIVSFEPAKDVYIPNTILKPETYFKDIIGITIPYDEQLQIITLHFTNDQKPYILTKPIHVSQQILSNDSSGLRIIIEVIPNYEFFSMILGFGGDVEVISPTKIREAIKEKLKTACKKYN